ncbi:MAG: DUF4174 domain-containing protein [Balneolaceae bacterium]|nr:MAG: DUF4174 domain-containing protein [Balneolaceae bacterium]
MKLLTLFLLYIFLIPVVIAQNEPLSDLDLSELRWQNRVLVIFAGDIESVKYQEQLRLIRDRMEGIKDRDLKVISIFEDGNSNMDGVNLSSSSVNLIRKRFEAKNNIFRFILIGKDGAVKLNSPETVSMDVLFERIDQMPMRRREINQ